MQLKVTKPLEELKADAITELKAEALKHVLVTSAFPEWKQSNYLQRDTELRFKELSGTATSSELQERAALSEVFTWKEGVITEVNRIEALVLSSISRLEIKTAMDSLSLSPPPLLLKRYLNGDN